MLGNCPENVQTLDAKYYHTYNYAEDTKRVNGLVKLFEKYPDAHTYHPVLKANEFEEGTGHHSMIREDGQWYAVYHARDYDNTTGADSFDARNARICKLEVCDGIITAKRYPDHI